jgi:hypothetical protein
VTVDRHHVTATDAGILQCPGKPVCRPRQFTVGPGVGPVAHGRRVGALARVSVEVGGHRTVPRPVEHLVGVGEHRRRRCGDQRVRRDRTVGVVGDLGEQGYVLRHERLHRRPVVQVPVVHQRHRDAVTALVVPLVDIDREVELGIDARLLEDLVVEAHQLTRHALLDEVETHHVEQDREERRPAEVSRWLQFGEQPLEGNILVVERVEGIVPNACQ